MSRQGIDLDRSTLADWVGRAAFELRPVFDALIADLKRSTKLFIDETRARYSIQAPVKPRPDTSGRWPVTTEHGAEVRHQVSPSPMRPVAPGYMPSGYCKGSRASSRWMDMPDIIA